MNVLAIGEVLFDISPKFKKIGGAPLNFLYHLSQLSSKYDLGIDCKLLTKLGNDENGNEALDFIQKSGISTQLIQFTDIYSTGYVNINFSNDGIPNYNIVENVAWDFIDMQPVIFKYLHSKADLMYIGSLFQRGLHNRSIVDQLFNQEEHIAHDVFFDVNIRQNYYCKEVIENTLIECNYLKINEEELHILKNVLCPNEQFSSENMVLEWLIDEFKLKMIFYTIGDKGAKVILQDGRLLNRNITHKVKLKDTVGAGDSFSALFLLGIYLEWNLHTCLDRAIEFSSRICEIEGALPQNAAWYDAYKIWF